MPINNWRNISRNRKPSRQVRYKAVDIIYTELPIKRTCDTNGWVAMKWGDSVCLTYKKNYIELQPLKNILHFLAAVLTKSDEHKAVPKRGETPNPVELLGEIGEAAVK